MIIEWKTRPYQHQTALKVGLLVNPLWIKHGVTANLREPACSYTGNFASNGLKS